MTDPSNIIAFQGEPGAYSHLACREAYPDMEPLPCTSFEDAFAAAETRRARLAMIPIENSLGGRVADIHHLLPHSSAFIVAEHFQAVKHCLLAPKGATLDGLKTIHSHPQALAQCRALIQEMGVTPCPRPDTAGAAREVAQSRDKSACAIASSLAAEIHALEILRERIEDRLGNTTRFVVMSATRVEPDPRNGPCMTAIIFQVRSVPAALYKALGGFATNGVNITKLESYLTEENFRVAQFYAEFEGHPAEKHVDHALEELQYFSTRLKILGTFPAHPMRARL